MTHEMLITIIIGLLIACIFLFLRKCPDCELNTNFVNLFRSYLGNDHGVKAGIVFCSKLGEHGEGNVLVRYFLMEASKSGINRATPEQMYESPAWIMAKHTLDNIARESQDNGEFRGSY